VAGLAAGYAAAFPAASRGSAILCRLPD